MELKLARMDLSHAVDWITTAALARSPGVVVTPNINHLHLIHESQEAHAAIGEADLQLADGWPIVAASRILGEGLPERVPGIDLVDLGQPAVGLQSVNLSVLPGYKRQLQRQELEAAAAAKVDALVAVYHSDHRELCAHERDSSFRIVNVLEIIGESMGLHQDDHYKRLKILQDAEAIVADCRDLIEQHDLDPDTARHVVAKTLLGDQPLPLMGDPGGA